MGQGPPPMIGWHEIVYTWCSLLILFQFVIFNKRVQPKSNKFYWICSKICFHLDWFCREYSMGNPRQMLFPNCKVHLYLEKRDLKRGSQNLHQVSILILKNTMYKLHRFIRCKYTKYKLHCFSALWAGLLVKLMTS